MSAPSDREPLSPRAPAAAGQLAPSVYLPDPKVLEFSTPTLKL